MSEFGMWALGILGTIVIAMAAAWAIYIMRKIESLDKKIEHLVIDIASYSGEVRLSDVTTSSRITAIVVRIDNNELRIKTIESKV